MKNDELILKDCYRFDDWTPIDTDDNQMLIRLSPTLEDLKNMVRRTPLIDFSGIDAIGGDGAEVYAYIKPDGTVEAKLQPVQYVNGEKFDFGETAKLPLTRDEQQKIVDAVDIELARNNVLFRLFDKTTDELEDLLRKKINGEYENFISDMQNGTTAAAIESAFEIVWKNNINDFCSEHIKIFGFVYQPQQYIALLSSKNTLDDVYERFCKNTYAHDYRVIGTVLKDTADEKLSSPAVTIKEVGCYLIDAWHGEDGFNPPYSYLIGQAVDDPSFYYARAMNGSFSREYEYDHKPTREEVISDHTDKLAEEDIDRHEAEFGADGYRAFLDEDRKRGEQSAKNPHKDTKNNTERE